MTYRVSCDVFGVCVCSKLKFVLCGWTQKLLWPDTKLLAHAIQYCKSYTTVHTGHTYMWSFMYLFPSTTGYMYRQKQLLVFNWKRLLERPSAGSFPGKEIYRRLRVWHFLINPILLMIIGTPSNPTFCFWMNIQKKIGTYRPLKCQASEGYLYCTVMCWRLQVPG
jgi:hypothetical protein